MDVDEAWAVLGLTRDDGWEAVRPAYRRLITEVHPDLAGTGTARRAARVNQAYTVLVRERRSGRPAAPGRKDPEPREGASRRDGHRAAAGSAAGATALGPFEHVGHDDGGVLLFFRMSPGEAFGRLLAAGHAVGDVGYVDRSSGVFETLVEQDGEVCSLLVLVDGRGGGAEVFVALEALGRAASLPPDPLVARMVEALGR